jgi:hypothetical protein
MQSKSAQAAVRGGKRKRNSADPAAGGASVLREFLKSAKAASGGPKQKRNSADLAAGRRVCFARARQKRKGRFRRPPKQKRNSADLAAGSESVLREFLKSGTIS